MNSLELIKSLIAKLNTDTWKGVYEPETIALALGNLDTIEEDMIHAIRTLLVCDLPWADCYVFENVVDALNGTPVISNILTMPPLEDICYAIGVMESIKPDKEYSVDIMKYICANAMGRGLVFLPSVLRFAQPYMNETDTSLGNDVKCHIQSNGEPVFDYEYKECPLDIQLQKIASIDEALRLKLLGT